MIRGTKPRGLPTRRHRRNAIIAGLLGAAAVSLGGYLALDSIPKEQKLTDLVVQEPTPQQVELQDDEVAEDVGFNSPEYARAAIKDYYAALAAGNVGKLRSLGATDAANAMERQWLSAINYSVDDSKISPPDKEGFPKVEGLYAGCSIYKISDFWNTPPTDAISSDVTGSTGCEGWIYYNPMKSEWVIADPTIPTAISGAEAPNVRRTSSDQLVTVQMSSPGAFSNPWWSFTQVAIDISDLSTQLDVWVSPAEFDEGFTVELADEFLQGVPHAESSATASVSQSEGDPTDANANSDSNANSNEDENEEKDPPNIVRSVAKVWRGDITSFNIEKIGAAPLSMEGDICPAEIVYNDERISPVFAMGDSESSELQSLMTQEQIERYKATGETIPSVEERLAEHADESQPQQSQPESQSPEEEGE